MSVFDKRLSRFAKNARLDSIVNIDSFSDEHVEDIWLLATILRGRNPIKAEAQLDELKMEEKYTLYQAACKAFNENDWSLFSNHRYPPSDSDLRDFLVGTAPNPLNVLFSYFLAALFRGAQKFLDDLTQTQEAMTYPKAVSAFREHMQGKA
ncbi:hypothetical protein C0995_003430, partial [Termitomyces sp. Mi166